MLILALTLIIFTLTTLSFKGSSLSKRLYLLIFFPAVSTNPLLRCK